MVSERPNDVIYLQQKLEEATIGINVLQNKSTNMENQLTELKNLMTNIHDIYQELRELKIRGEGYQEAIMKIESQQEQLEQELHSRDKQNLRLVITTVITSIAAFLTAVGGLILEKFVK